METRKTFFDYLIEALTTFGVTILIIVVLCILVGDDARELSTIFQLGGKGIACSTVLEFSIISVIITGIRYFFLTDRFIKKMPVPARTVCMIISVLCVAALFIYLFEWFPIDMWQCWFAFFICFLICSAISTIFSILREKMQNRALEKALRQLQQEEKSSPGGSD